MTIEEAIKKGEELNRELDRELMSMTFTQFQVAILRMGILISLGALDVVCGS